MGKKTRGPAEAGAVKRGGAAAGVLGGMLRSRRGSSMLYALLILLICVVISSVVLTAGTAAAGRIANVAEGDRRYYAVTSAVELFRDMFDDREIEVVWTRTAYQSRKYEITVDDDNNPTVTDESLGTPLRTIHQVLHEDDQTYYTAVDYETDAVHKAEDLLMNAVLDLVLGTNRTSLSEEERKTFLDNVWIDSSFEEQKRVFVSSATKRELTLTLDGEGTGADGMTVYVTYQLQSDGTFTLIIASDRDDPSAGSGSAGKNVYSVCLTFRPMINDEVKVGIPYDTDTQDPIASVDGSGHNVITQYYDKTTAYERRISYRWVLSNITTVSAAGGQNAGDQQQITETAG
jgi:hypothetical protein